MIIGLKFKNRINLVYVLKNERKVKVFVCKVRLNHIKNMNKYELILIASVGIFTYIIVYFLIVDSKYGLKPTRRRVEKLADAKSITDFKKDGGIFASQGGESMFSFIRASEKLRRYLIASGVRLPEEYLLIWLIAALLPALLYYLFKGFSYGNCFNLYRSNITAYFSWTI